MLTLAVNDDACLHCGACCAHYRVSFYWAEGESIPTELVEQLTPLYACMKGTNQSQPRCSALSGEIGKSVNCGIYAMRSSTCKEVQIGDEQCNKARLAYGFIPVIQIEDKPAENDSGFDQVC